MSHVGHHDEWVRETRLESLLDDRELPRRLEVGRPGWHRFLGRITVLRDGKEVSRCTAFDADKGLVRVQKLDGEGRIYLEDDKVAQETLRGRVEVRWK